MVTAPMYMALGRLKQAEAVLTEPSAEVLAPIRDEMLVSILRLTADPAPIRDLIRRRWRPILFRPDFVELLIHAGLLDEAEAELRSRRERFAAKGLPIAMQTDEASLALKRGNASHAIELLQDVRIPVAPFSTSNASLARTRALAWEALGDVPRAIEALKAIDVTRHVIGATSNAGIWLEHRGLMARLYRLAGQNDEARIIEEELRKLLALADSDHPVRRALKSQEPGSR